MGQYTALSQRTYNLIKRKGATITISRATETSDPVAQTKATTPSAVTSKAVAVDLDVIRAPALIGALAKRTLARVYVSCFGLSITPEMGDKVTWASNVWKVAHSKPIDPDGTASIVADVYLER